MGIPLRMRLEMACAHLLRLDNLVGLSTPLKHGSVADDRTAVPAAAWTGRGGALVPLQCRRLWSKELVLQVPKTL